MPKNELINAINILKPTKTNKNNIFTSKRKEIKKSLMKPSKKVFKSKIKEIKEILYDPILDRDEKIDEIKKILYDPKNNLFKPNEDIYSISDIQDYFEYIFKKHSENVDNSSIKIYINKIEIRITCKVKNGYYLELLTPETMKLLGSTESKITKDKNGENVPHLEVVELVLVHCNIINNYQQDSRILYTFVPNKPFGSLLEISPTNKIFLKTFNSEFQEIKV